MVEVLPYRPFHTSGSSAFSSFLNSTLDVFLSEKIEADLRIRARQTVVVLFLDNGLLFCVKVDRSLKERGNGAVYSERSV